MNTVDPIAFRAIACRQCGTLVDTRRENCHHCGVRMDSRASSSRLAAEPEPDPGKCVRAAAFAVAVVWHDGFVHGIRASGEEVEVNFDFLPERLEPVCRMASELAEKKTGIVPFRKTAAEVDMMAKSFRSSARIFDAADAKYAVAKAVDIAAIVIKNHWRAITTLAVAIANSDLDENALRPFLAGVQRHRF
jgi:hypothetical protein